MNRNFIYCFLCISFGLWVFITSIGILGVIMFAKFDCDYRSLRYIDYIFPSKVIGCALAQEVK